MSFLPQAGILFAAFMALLSWAYARHSAARARRAEDGARATVARLAAFEKEVSWALVLLNGIKDEDTEDLEVSPGALSEAVQDLWYLRHNVGQGISVADLVRHWESTRKGARTRGARR